MEEGGLVPRRWLVDIDHQDPDGIAGPAALALFYEHLERVLLQAGFLNPDNPRNLMRRLRRLFNRTQLDENELNILRGILSAVAPGSGDRPAGTPLPDAADGESRSPDGAAAGPAGPERSPAGRSGHG